MIGGSVSGQGQPVTRAQRGFGPEQLASLSRDNVRKLCHALWIAEGAAVQSFSRQAEFDQFVLSVPSLWASDSRLVRIYHREVSPADLEDMVNAAHSSGAVASMVIPAAGISVPSGVPGELHVVQPEELTSRITRSALVEWDDDLPRVALERLDLYLQLSDASLLDPVGIQWLPSLALNEMPPQIVEVDSSPQDLFERKAFRLLTACFRFGGVRYGEARRGERLPDAVLYWPDGSSTSAMVDCKAASSGYRMEADHLLRFEEYWENLGEELAAEGHDLAYLLVLSSYFSGQPSDRNPYHGRAEEVEERTGLKLAYIMASDLAWAAAEIESGDFSLESRAQLGWGRVFDKGLVQAEHLEEAIRDIEG